MKITLGRYIWRNDRADLPVNVIGLFGMGSDGRFYVQIEGSTSAIPADELVNISTEEADAKN